jgi:hypothetical protein
MRGLAVLSSAATRPQGRRALRVMDGAYGLRQVTQSQSAVSALVSGLPDASPSRIVSQLNRVLRLDIRERLDESDQCRAGPL